MEEQGVNTLYLALGMLCWREEDNSEKFCRAPLILIPVELGQSDARDRFHLKYAGDELGENVSLAEKLKQSFGIRKFRSCRTPTISMLPPISNRPTRRKWPVRLDRGHRRDCSGFFLLR